MLLVGCGGSGSAGATNDACNELSGETFNCDEMLSDLVSEGVMPIVQDFKTAMVSLDDVVVAYCADSNELSDARLAWTNAMVPLQQLQAMNFGPNSDSDNGLLSFYDWQTASPFNIDIAIAQRTRFPDTIRLPGTDNEKDLIAIEYILFDVNAVQAYPDPSKENIHVKAWRESSSNIQQDRCDYAALVTDALKDKAVDLESQWLEYDLASESTIKQIVANKVAEALFYIDKITKDEKIKATVPQDDNGAGSTFDASELESQFANESKEAILNNLIGAQILLTLNDSDNSKTALNDYLIAAGQEDTATEMATALSVAIANVGLITGDLFTAVSNSDASNETTCKEYSSGSLEYTSADSPIKYFCALQHTVKNFTDILKGDFTFLTSFTVPASASGDND